MNFIKNALIALVLFFMGGAYSLNCPTAHLSQEQKASIRHLKRQFKADTRDSSRKEKKQKREELNQDILNEVLTHQEQRTAYKICLRRQKWRIWIWCPELNLSKEQKKTIRRQRRQFKSETRVLSREEKERARNNFYQDVSNNILDGGQRETLTNCENRQ